MNLKTKSRNLKARTPLLFSMITVSLMALGWLQPEAAFPIIQQAVLKNKMRGVVVDVNGDPIVGASVLVKGTSMGTITDLDGNFSIAHSDAVTLVVSYVGFKTKEVKVSSRTPLAITLLEDSRILNDVVVVGYGTQRKEELTSSVTSIKSDDFLQGENNDAASLIRGKVAGLAVVNSSANPLAGSEIMLRGVTTLKANAAPLVIIDGVPGTLKDVSPNDIEQIDVLKDGSAAAIYGTRGTNGVIIITTKRAKGELQPTININSYISTQSVVRKLAMLTADEYRQKAKDGIVGATDYGGNTNWLNEILQTPFNQTYSIDLKGGSGKTNYVASLDYTSNEGLVKKSNVKVLYPRINVIHRMWDNLLKLEVQLSGYHRTYGIPYNANVYKSALLYNPTYAVKNDDDTWNEHGSSPLISNPVALLKEARGDNKDTKIKMYGKATLTPASGLSVSVLGSKEVDNFFGGYYETKQHKSTTLDGCNGFASRTTSRIQNDLLELTVQYTNRFNLHNLNALIGYSCNNYNYQYAYMDNRDFPADDFTYNNMGQGAGLKKGQGNESTNQVSSRLVGYFARANYNYANRYFLSASIRYEGSSKFGNDHKWGAFPAVSVGWNIAQEEFMKPIKSVSTMKLRAGYGVTGTEPGNSYMSLSRLNMGGYGYFRGEWINLLRPGGNPNPALRWEKKKQNVGFDFGFFEDRINGSIDFYRRTTNDLIWDYSVPVPPYVTNGITANAGTIRNTGLELNLSFIPVIAKDFQWNSNINFSTNSNRLVSLSNDEFIAGDYFDLNQLTAPIQQPTTRAEEGQSLGNFYGYKSVGVDDNGRWLIEGADGKVKPIAEQTAEDKQIIGNGLPKWYLNFSNTFRYKWIDLSMTMRGAFGFQILNEPEMYYGSPVALGNGNVLRSAFEPKYGKVLNNSQELQYVSYYVQDGDYWKIDNITIGFTPNVKAIKWIKSLRLYASISNLATITGYKGIDPEVGISGLTPGIDPLERYPSARTYTLGINLTF